MAETLPSVESWESEVDRVLPLLAEALGAVRVCLFAAGAPEPDLSASAVIPVKSGHELWGNLAVYSLSGEWSESQADGLRIAAGMIGARIHHRQSHEELRVAHDRLRFVLSSSPVILLTN